MKSFAFALLLVVLLVLTSREVSSSFLSGIGRNIGNAIKGIAPSIIRSVAGPARSVLQGITSQQFGSFVQRLPTSQVSSIITSMRGPALSSLVGRLLGGSSFNTFVSKAAPQRGSAGSGGAPQRFSAPRAAFIPSMSPSQVPKLMTAMKNIQKGISSRLSSKQVSVMFASIPRQQQAKLFLRIDGKSLNKIVAKLPRQTVNQVIAKVAPTTMAKLIGTYILAAY